MSHNAVRHLGLALLGVAFAFALGPLARGSQASKDSKEVSKLLSDVKTEAIQLQHDADELKALTRQNLSWKSHETKITEIKEHVNNAGKILAKLLDDEKAAASPWQQQAINRVTPLLKELAANVTATIDHLNQKPALLQTGPYQQYVSANYDLATSLAELISDYVEYGESKAKAEQLAAELETPRN